MIDPLIQLGQWINETDYGPVMLITVIVGVLDPRLGFLFLSIWFIIAWIFV